MAKISNVRDGNLSLEKEDSIAKRVVLQWSSDSTLTEYALR